MSDIVDKLKALQLSEEMHLAMLMVAPKDPDAAPMPAEMVGAGLGVLMRHILVLQERVMVLEAAGIGSPLTHAGSGS